MRKRTNIPTMAPSLLMRSMSVIFTALADLTRNITDILQLLSLLLDLEMEEEKEVEETEEEVQGTMYKFIPPSFQHERAVGESEANLSEPDPECAGHNVRPRVEDQGLEQSNTEIENESSSCDF